jgi:phosphoadenosine phosphosulfate reductase
MLIKGELSMYLEKMGSFIDLSLNEKENISSEIIQKYLANSKSHITCFSGGKKSTVLLHLLRRNYAGPLRALRVNTTLDFDNINQYCEKMRKLWRLEILEVTPEDTDSKIIGVSGECCKKLIWGPLRKAISENRIDFAFIGFTHDSKSKFTKDLTMDGDSTKYIYPLFHFTDADIREYIKKYNLPCCSLYDHGYTNIDCKPCTATIAEKAMDKGEEERIKEKLRKLGYL